MAELLAIVEQTPDRLALRPAMRPAERAFVEIFRVAVFGVLIFASWGLLQSGNALALVGVTVMAAAVLALGFLPYRLTLDTRRGRMTRTQPLAWKWTPIGTYRLAVRAVGDGGSWTGELALGPHKLARSEGHASEAEAKAALEPARALVASYLPD